MQNKIATSTRPPTDSITPSNKPLSTGKKTLLYYGVPVTSGILAGLPFAVRHNLLIRKLLRLAKNDKLLSRGEVRKMLANFEASTGKHLDFYASPVPNHLSDIFAGKGPRNGSLADKIYRALTSAKRKAYARNAAYAPGLENIYIGAEMQRNGIPASVLKHELGHATPGMLDLEHQKLKDILASFIPGHGTRYREELRAWDNAAKMDGGIMNDIRDVALSTYRNGQYAQDASMAGSIAGIPLTKDIIRRLENRDRS